MIVGNADVAELVAAAQALMIGKEGDRVAIKVDATLTIHTLRVLQTDQQYGTEKHQGRALQDAIAFMRLALERRRPMMLTLLNQVSSHTWDGSNGQADDAVEELRGQEAQAVGVVPASAALQFESIDAYLSKSTQESIVHHWRSCQPTENSGTLGWRPLRGWKPLYGVH